MVVPKHLFAKEEVMESKLNNQKGVRIIHGCIVAVLLFTGAATSVPGSWRIAPVLMAVWGRSTHTPPHIVVIITWLSETVEVVLL